MTISSQFIFYFSLLIGLYQCIFPNAESVAADKDFVISLPIVTLGREGALRGEYNLNNNATIALEWSKWSGDAAREELTNTEIEEDPQTSLITEGSNIGIMLGRYSNPKQMSGFHWGLGAGYRKINAKWKKTPNSDTDESASLDEDGKVNYNIVTDGLALNSRVGYRYVGKEIGFVSGLYMAYKHFQNNMNDNENQSENEIKFTNIAQSDKTSLQRRFMSQFHIGLEIGWAF